jgi:threonine dehydrogenase-like Zn-dependent dehydrogenase
MSLESDHLPKRMNAVVNHGRGDFRYEELPVPQPGPEEVLIRVLTTGICGSDIKCFQGAPWFWGDESRTGWCQPPVTPGHEFVGEVVGLGPGALEKYGLEIGDHAVSENIVPCWKCRYCRYGQYWLCAVHDIYGFRRRTQGSWAEYMLFPRGALNYKVPKTIPIDHAMFIEPLSCSIHAVERADIGYQDTVVIAGCGPLGLGMIAAAKLKGPALLIAVDPNDDRLELAKLCGADLGINVKKKNAVGRVLDLTEGYGCDVYIEGSGKPAAVEQGLQMIRKLGRFVEFSVMSEKATVDWTIIGDTKELDIRGSHLGPHCYPVAIRMLEKRVLPMESIVTHRFSLSEFARGMERVATHHGSMKVIIEPSK